MKKVDPHIWNTSPACNITFKELVKAINDVIDKINDIESNNHKIELFKNRRCLLNMSMQDVSNKTGISKATISRIEKGNDALYVNVIKLEKFYTDREQIELHE